MAVPQIHKVHYIQASGADKVKVADIPTEIEKCSWVCQIPTSLTEQDSQIEGEAQPTLCITLVTYVCNMSNIRMTPNDRTQINNLLHVVI